MPNCDAEKITVDAHVAPQEFCPNTRCQFLGLVERRATDDEVLQHILELEYSRQGLQRYTTDLVRLVDQSAKATRQSELADRNKSDFLATMSHEIRTPLNGIIGMTEILLARSLEGTERDCIEIIRRSGEALLSIVDDILDFSKIEAGALELEPAEFEPLKAVEQAVLTVQPVAARKSLRLRTQVDPALPPLVLGDAARLRQILLNLLSNAIKFTPEGDIEIRVGVRSAIPPEHILYFSITDQGIGLTEEQISRLFQPFRQADASINRRFGGTGLGLSICKRLAEMMGGEIGVESCPGKGASFWFTIKVLSAGASRAQADLETSGPGARLHGPAKSFRLLLVEDNAINQKVAIMMLKKLGYQVDLAGNGLEALDAVTRERYDLILMDCLMPEIDGFEATRRIRSSGGNAAQIPIIAMTANAFSEDRAACLAAGMTDYLSKPVRELELANKIEHWLSRDRAPTLIKAEKVVPLL